MKNHLIKVHDTAHRCRRLRVPETILKGMKPPVWHRLKVASDLDLPQLHIILQAAMGWELEHLHSFEAWNPAARQYIHQSLLSRYNVDMEGEEGVAEYDVQIGHVLHSVGDKLMYWYDFGDDWRPEIVLEKLEPWVADSPLAMCVGGRKTCPPEDCGGP
ncbi:MAG: plasmid pRiA4b ORF-3 family protein [Propionibacteriaceae bacterium]|jgi:hypothetical protein|nr:plasmid pRiA4b ORF-3 family protein [Propionibacteriaceae bacterium]